MIELSPLQEQILLTSRNFNKSMKAAALVLGRDLPPHIRRVVKTLETFRVMYRRAHLNSAGYRMVNKRGRNKLVKLQKGHR